MNKQFMKMEKTNMDLKSVERPSISFLGREMEITF